MICSRSLTISWPRFLTESYSPRLDPRPLTHGHLQFCVVNSILSIGELVVLAAPEVGGFSLNQNYTLERTFLYPILPGGDGSGCQCCRMWRISNLHRTGSVRSCRHRPRVSTKCAKCQSTPGRVLVTYG